MVFNSIGFLIFFPCVVFLYFVLPQRIRWIMLLVASYYFYMSWNAQLIFLILFTTVVSYFSALVIDKYKRKPDKQPIRRLAMIITLVLTLGTLVIFKYFNFLSHSVTTVLRWFSLPVHEVTKNLILPVGISFYTFQTLSYVIDVYRGSIRAERHFGYYALFVSFFPQLVAGPIERPENLIPQLRKKHKWNQNDVIAGLRMMAIGFFKKMVVADLAAPYVDAVYNNPSAANGLSIVIATVLFTFQIYGDFAGYTDIAIGCSRIMGIRLKKNFNSPYISESIKEFWGRWHISLSTWFRDYVYIPLGGSRCSKIRHLRNIMIVFLTSGLWHGADWTFVLWGGLHGLYQWIGILTKNIKLKILKLMGISENSKFVHQVRRIITFILVSFAWMFFRANSSQDLGILFQSLVNKWSIQKEYFIQSMQIMDMTWVGAAISVVSIAVMSRLDKEQRILEQIGERYTRISMRYIYMVWVILLAWMILQAGNGTSAFIYFQF